ncbi:MAG: hypothetical protein JSU79_03570 [Dehalococcoidales bacterium]|nr:MAG: hypothetical protein JSU79_03570 [Dehalococcoidales bacterium]
MGVDGNYTVEINSPVGTRTASLLLRTDGNSLNGTLFEEQGEHILEDGKVSDNEFSFNVRAGTPMGEIKLNIQGSVNGDIVSGDVQIGDFGSFTFKGNRS